MKNYFLFLYALFSLPCTLSSFLQIHTVTFTCTPNNSFTAICGVTNFSWALDLSAREGEEEKMKERRSSGPLAAQKKPPTSKKPDSISCVVPLTDCLSVLHHKPVRAPEQPKCVWPPWDHINLITVYSPASHTGDKSQSMHKTN